MRRLKLTIEYDGSHFWGWQRLLEAGSGPTVQGGLEAAWHQLTGEKIESKVAGRTDRGVHATGQVAHFDTATDLPLVKVMGGVNHHLQPHALVTRVAVVDDDFHARFSAQWRQYRFRLFNRRGMSPLWHGRATLVREALDEKLMHQAAQQLLGEHDFSAFRSVDCGSSTPLCRILETQVRRMGQLVVLDIKGDHFLHNMVRIVTGTLCQIGAGQRPAEDLAELFKTGERQQAGPTLAPDGLSLHAVGYGEHVEHDVLEMTTTGLNP